MPFSTNYFHINENQVSNWKNVSFNIISPSVFKLSNWFSLLLDKIHCMSIDVLISWGYNNKMFRVVDSAEMWNNLKPNRVLALKNYLHGINWF